MALEKLSFVLFSAFIFFNNNIVETKDCTPPWAAESNPFISLIQSKTLFSCPPIFGDQEKKYCCYNSNGDVECCNFGEYLLFSFICLIPLIIILLIILVIIIGICCFLCPFCKIYNRRHN